MFEIEENWLIDFSYLIFIFFNLINLKNKRFLVLRIVIIFEIMIIAAFIFHILEINLSAQSLKKIYLGVYYKHQTIKL